MGGGDVSFELGSQDLLKALGCMVLSGPFLTGYTQVSSLRLSRAQPSAIDLFPPVYCVSCSGGLHVAVH